MRLQQCVGTRDGAVRARGGAATSGWQHHGNGWSRRRGRRLAADACHPRWAHSEPARGGRPYGAAASDAGQRRLDARAQPGGDRQRRAGPCYRACSAGSAGRARPASGAGAAGPDRPRRTGSDDRGNPGMTAGVSPAIALKSNSRSASVRINSSVDAATLGCPYYMGPVLKIGLWLLPAYLRQNGLPGNLPSRPSADGRDVEFEAKPRSRFARRSSESAWIATLRVHPALNGWACSFCRWSTAA